MTDRIDHAVEAVALLNLAVTAQRQGDPRHLIAAAHVHATLAVAEQARIANLVALAKLAGRDEDAHEEVAAAAYGALNAMIRYQCRMGTQARMRWQSFALTSPPRSASRR